MANELIFYNDEYDDHQFTKPPPKPRKRPTTDQPGDWDVRVREQEASKTRQSKFTKPENSILVSHYVEGILPVYCCAYYSLFSRPDELRADVPASDRYNWQLMEDNGPGRGTHNQSSFPAAYRHDHVVNTFAHPANT